MLKLLLTCLILSFSAAAEAEIFKYRDSDGRLYITDKKLGSPYQLMIEQKPLNIQSRSYSTSVYKKNVRKYSSHIKRASIKYEIDSKLLHAMIDTESSFNPKAYSKAGAVGLMQLMPNTAKSLGVKNSWNPDQNIQGGALYFRRLLDMFDQNIRLSLAAYNAGEGAVRRAGNIIPNYPETQRYVRKVIQKYTELKQAG